MLPKFPLIFSRNDSDVYTLEFSEMGRGKSLGSLPVSHKKFTVRDMNPSSEQKTMSEEELNQIAIEDEFPVVKYAITVD